MFSSFRLVLLMSVATQSFAQYTRVSFSTIDWRVQTMEAPSVDSLASKLTAPYHTDLEKTRAIFSWIAQHISYNTAVYNSTRRYGHTNYAPDIPDTISEWKSAEEMTARKVFRRRVAVCDGYAKLFKTLCDYAGIRAEVVTGYAKCNLERTQKFKTNHTWNAVLIDSAWRLVDVTWGSGYVSFADEYVQRIDDNYFLPDPRQFIVDHYPEDLRWTLLADPPAIREFKFAPYKCKSFIKYGISSIVPQNGQIEAAIGDTVHIELETHDAVRDSKMSADPFFDSTILTTSPSSAFLQPTMEGNKIFYTYVVGSGAIEWLHLLYNGDVILRYRLLRKDKNYVMR